MKQTRYTEEQIAYALRQAEAEAPLVGVISKFLLGDQAAHRRVRRCSSGLEITTVGAA